MRKSTIILVSIACILSALALLAYAQQPPDYAPDGVPFLKVNINPTPIPPGVNINPYQAVPLVEVAKMPEMKFEPMGCEDGRNFRTSIGSSIRGPMLVTYLNMPQQGEVRLVDGQGTRAITLSSQVQVNTAIYLGAGEALEFDSATMYSGCIPQ